MGKRGDIFNDYEGFVDKFKYKHTTDDCYTPDDVYNVVLDYARSLEGFPDGAEVVRPFYPGGDYERYNYTNNCVVVDNPPFSIFAKITRFYSSRGIKFFLFGSHLTLFSANLDVTYIVTDFSITYKNGARINTGFITNMAWEYRIIVDNVLKGRLMACASQQIKKKQTTKYKWPNNLVSAALLGKLCRVGVDNLYIKKKDCERISGKFGGCNHLFGGGFLLSEKAAAEKSAVEKAAA